jgi:hypothetical protein
MCLIRRGKEEAQCCFYTPQPSHSVSAKGFRIWFAVAHVVVLICASCTNRSMRSLRTQFSEVPAKHRDENPVSILEIVAHNMMLKVPYFARENDGIVDSDMDFWIVLPTSFLFDHGP